MQGLPFSPNGVIRKSNKIFGRKNKVSRLRTRDGDLCSICAQPMLFDITAFDCPRFATIDHILPRSKDGNNAMGNLRLACKICNSQRGDHYLPSMGGIAKHKALPQKLHIDYSEDITVYIKCSRCDTMHAVFNWKRRHPDGICPLCLDSPHATCTESNAKG
jgi:hypothetical protein